MTFSNSARFIFSTIIVASTLSTSINLNAEEINLEGKDLTPVDFKRITPNNFDVTANVLSIHVNKSASFLLLPFDNVKQVNKISFLWKKAGEINVTDARHEETRQGDDAYLRVGLILEGNSSLINPLAPKWVKKVRETLHHASDNMIYFVPGSKHKAGQQWKSPYSDDVEIIAVGSTEKPGGWMFSEYTLESSQAAVGLWIMADGDNTQSSFSSMLRALTLN